ncbi:hypothetical protein AYM40_10570 [Paraburkholderia phytofirmans OLGA172]|uniref:AAA+ ATPase domain-containing protein n=1 Tax=Paraburkholderia phytofirmans OLGA172 TaxID=1417228 RepID=A0A160FKY3_9BURK|nr:hypothetical protein AYM40_10570 [Paraburkholderia phytofirmans OLGA172]
MRLFQHTMRAIRTGVSGYHFLGAHRDGITRTLFVLQAMVEQAAPGVVTAYLTFSRGKRVDPLRHVCLSLLQSGNCPNVHGKTEDLRIRAFQRFVGEGRNIPKSTIVLFLDNVQDCAPEDIFAIDDLRHELDRNGIPLLVLSAGHSSGMHAWQSSLKKNKVDAAVRKMLVGHRLQFSAIASPEEVRGILQLIDLKKSDETGETWTSFFLPEQTDRGFTLESETENFIMALGGRENTKRIFYTGIPQGAFFETVRLFLDHAADEGPKAISDRMRQEFWTFALYESDFFDAIEDKIEEGVANGMAARRDQLHDQEEASLEDT